MYITKSYGIIASHQLITLMKETTMMNTYANITAAQIELLRAFKPQHEIEAEEERKVRETFWVKK